VQTLLEAAGAAAALKAFLLRARPPATPSRALLREHPAPGPGTRRTIACTFRLRSAAASRAARSARAACSASYCARAVSSPTTCSSQPLRGHPDATGHIASVRQCAQDAFKTGRIQFPRTLNASWTARNLIAACSASSGETLSGWNLIRKRAVSSHPAASRHACAKAGAPDLEAETPCE